jgi:twitching motility protein PilU
MVDRKEGLANADSPTNLMWRLQNDFSLGSQPPGSPEDIPRTKPSFTEITLDVKH